MLYHVSHAETLIKRQSTRHDRLPSLLGDREKLSEIVCSEEKMFCTRPAKTGQKFIFYRHNEPNEPTKEDPFHMYSLGPHLPQFQQSAGAIPH
jgi:hypothetical protein